jgi:hypothetical protein
METLVHSTTWKIEIARSDANSRMKRIARGTWIPGRPPLLIGHELPAEVLRDLRSKKPTPGEAHYHYTVETEGFLFTVQCRR